MIAEALLDDGRERSGTSLVLEDEGEGGDDGPEDEAREEVEGGVAGFRTGLGGMGDLSAHLCGKTYGMIISSKCGHRAGGMERTRNSKFVAVGVTTSISWAVEALCIAFGPGEANDTLPTRTLWTTVRDCWT